VIIVCGKKEAEERTVNIRRLGSQQQTSMSLEEAIASLTLEATPPDVIRKAEARKAKAQARAIA
jgi:threonyl-tRNA synthetase